MNPRLSTPVPARMEHLPRDKRGYPIPHIVTIDNGGKPHFTVNDAAKSEACALDGRCGICNGKLYPKRLWMVGGPLSAFHPHGAYFDGPLHYECARYALTVCPFLAMPSYTRRIEGAGLDTEANGIAMLVDRTVMPERPLVYVLAATDKLDGSRGSDGMLRFHPRRPWKTVEFWKDGVNIDIAEGSVLSQAAMSAFVQQN
jgi:hypothetical protein